MVARYLERRLEQLVEGLAGLVFRGTFQPGELASRLLREADLAEVDTDAGPAVPNHFTVTTANLDPGDDLAAVEAELASFLEDAAAQRGWRLGGPVLVRLVPDGSHVGRPIVHTTTVDGARPPWAVLDFARESKPVTDNRVVIGRSERADIVLAEPEVSRRHALLVREGGDVRIEDLGSANGTMVNGRPVQRAELVPGATVSFGTTMATFRTT